MGDISARARKSGKVEGLPEGARLLERVARPLTGLEVREALGRHLLALSSEMKEVKGETREFFAVEVEKALARPSELGKMNLVYPGVGWRAIVVLEALEDEREWLRAEVQLDLAPGRRLELLVGLEGRGIERARLEEEQLQSKAPDLLRAQRGLPVELEYVVPSTGARGRVPARSVEVGGGATRAPKIVRDVDGLSKPEDERQARLNQESIAALERELAEREGGKKGDEKASPVPKIEPNIDGPSSVGAQLYDKPVSQPVELPAEDLLGDPPKQAGGGRVVPKVSIIPKVGGKKMAYVTKKAKEEEGKK